MVCCGRGFIFQKKRIIQQMDYVKGVSKVLVSVLKRFLQYVLGSTVYGSLPDVMHYTN